MYAVFVRIQMYRNQKKVHQSDGTPCALKGACTV